MPFSAFEPAPLSHPLIPQLMAQLRTQPPLQIPRVNQYAAGFSYWSVFDHARQNGGFPVIGWNIAWSPETLLSAVHHAVWMRPDGTLIDLTAAGPSQQGRSTFLAIVNQADDPVDLRFPVTRPNITIPLVEHPDLIESDRRYQQWLRLHLKLTDMLKRMGYAWNPAQGWFGGTQAAAADMLGQQVLNAQQSFLDHNAQLYNQPV